LPKRITFVGGGYISFEFAHVAARAGAKVQIIHRGPRPLEKFDPDLVDKLVEATREAGIEVHLNAVVKSIEQTNDQLLVKALANGAIKTFETDMAVHGAGRVPDIDDMDLDRASIRREKNGISVNEFLQSVSNRQIYAAGDASAGSALALTPVASMEAQVVAANILEGNHFKPNYNGVPTVAFTLPPLAAVGLREEDAKKGLLKFKTRYGDTSNWYSSRRLNLKHSGFKVLVEENSERILGAHLLGAHAEETINLFALAIRAGLKTDDLREMIYAYPSHASDVIYMLK
jgi:glutathione reductase (NADPH)